MAPLLDLSPRATGLGLDEEAMLLAFDPMLIAWSCSTAISARALSDHFFVSQARKRTGKGRPGLACHDGIDERRPVIRQSQHITMAVAMLQPAIPVPLMSTIFGRGVVEFRAPSLVVRRDVIGWCRTAPCPGSHAWPRRLLRSAQLPLCSVLLYNISWKERAENDCKEDTEPIVQS